MIMRRCREEDWRRLGTPQGSRAFYQVLPAALWRHRGSSVPPLPYPPLSTRTSLQPRHPCMVKGGGPSPTAQAGTSQGCRIRRGRLSGGTYSNLGDHAQGQFQAPLMASTTRPQSAKTAALRPSRILSQQQQH